MAPVASQDPAQAKPQKASNSRPSSRKKKEKTQTELRDELFANGSDFKPTHLTDVVGIDNVIDEIEKVVHYLRNCSAYRSLGARLEPGIVLEGDPGTGKTLVSRYIATRADAWFISVRDFPCKDRVPSPADIRDLFRRARKLNKETNRPVILFWDEFEIAAQERGSDHTTSEEASVTSQLTSELDGIEGKDAGVLLIGCTNYAYRIDQALLRSGRMGLQIEFHAPSREGKQEILDHYLANVNCKEGIDCETLSFFFAKDATAADIEESVMEAWRYAVRRSLLAEDELTPALEQRDLMDVFVHRLVGPATTFSLPESERYQVSIHECGHAIMALVYGIPLRLITVQPGRRSLGRVMYDDVQQYTGTQDQMVDRMRVALGSLAAEQISGLPQMLGGKSDIHHANAIASGLVDDLNYGQRMGIFHVGGFGESRQSAYSKITPQVSDETVRSSDLDILDLLNKTQGDAFIVMQRIGRGRLHHIANTVHEKVTMTGREFEGIFRKIAGDPEQYRAS